MSTPIAVAEKPGDPDNLLLYYVDENVNLALEPRPLDLNVTFPRWKGHGRQGFITVPSSLAAATYQGLPTVYGITDSATSTTDTTSDDPTHLITQLSPVYNPLSTTNGKTFATTGKAIAACAHEDVAWVYYSNQGVGNTFTVSEVTVQENDSSMTTLPVVTIDENSSLAAVNIGTTARYIFCTNASSGNYIIQVRVDQFDYKTIPYTDGLADGTPLALAFREKSAGPVVDSKIRLYYVDRNQQLNRIQSESWSGELKWGENAVLSNAPLVSANSGLAAQWTDNGVYLYYIQNGDDVVDAYVDAV